MDTEKRGDTLREREKEREGGRGRSRGREREREEEGYKRIHLKIGQEKARE